MFILSRKQALKATQEGFLKNGEEMLGNLFNIWFLSAEQSLTNDVIENHVRWEFINVLYQVIKIAIHVQLVLHFKTFLARISKQNHDEKPNRDKYSHTKPVNNKTYRFIKS